nr:hypothetical protein [uncultured Desulfuromonas sp.]
MDRKLEMALELLQIDKLTPEKQAELKEFIVDIVMQKAKEIAGNGGLNESKNGWHNKDNYRWF